MAGGEKFASLQVGRGVAALLVLLFHAGSLLQFNGGALFAGGVFRFGAAGVDFFFVLSGFIIFYRHARDFGHPERLGDYGWRRFARVYPVYWVVTLAVLPAYFLLPGFGQGYETRPDVVATSFLLLPANQGPVLYVGWSLVHELWFYLLIGGLIAFRGRWFRYPVAVWCAVVAGSAFWFQGTSWFSNPWIRVAFSPLNFEFVLGCLAAWLVTRPRAAQIPNRIWRGLLGAGVAAFLGFGLAHSHVPEILSHHRVSAYGFSAFLIVLGAVGSTPWPPFRSSRVMTGMVFLGDASYSLYLVHVPVLSAVWKAAEVLGIEGFWGSQPVAWAAVATSIVTAGLFHRLIEGPLLRWVNHRHRTGLVAPAPVGGSR
jgi:exopolysaccharide production protein ExoZ